MKVRIGVSFEKEIVDAIEKQVVSSPDLSLDRSEIVNAVMKAFFRTSLDHRAKTRELVIMSRNGQLKPDFVHIVHKDHEIVAPILSR